MTKENIKKLCTDMPYMIPRNARGEISAEYDYTWSWLDEIPSGWEKLFIQMCEDLREPIERMERGGGPEFFFTQVKEKYGGLRAYTIPANREIYDIIDKYEYLSTHICERCGAPSRVETTGWISYLCEDCLSTINAHSTYIEPVSDFKFIVDRYSKEHGYVEETVDCNEEWNRLMNKS